MKKKIVSTLLCTAMLVTMMAGCGGNNAANTSTNSGNSSSADTGSSDAAATDEAAPATEAAASDASASDEGKVLNIYCWNEEFKSRVTDHYPGYTEVDATTGTIGDVTVKWNITPNDDNAYQNNLDATLLKQADAAADDKIDIFLVEADYALKYVDTDYTMAVSDLGITDSDLSKQYQYTKDVVTDSNGVLKGVSWQGCPGVLFYNRDAAKAVLGSDDPSEVQNYVKDWDTFNDTAKKMKDAGYTITSSANDTYRVYSNNVTSKWVVDGKINIDDNIMKWVDDSKELVDAGETGTYELWSDDWKKGFYPEGNVFCYFGPAWLVNFSMAADTEGSIGYNGGWGATEGPQGFFWGGTWICAANGTAVAGGLEIALACDIIVASENARFGLSEVKVGFLATSGGLIRLPNIIPKKIASEMVLTGKLIDAQRAYEVGLVNYVVPREQVMDKAMELAEIIAANAPISLKLSKEIFHVATQCSFEDAQRYCNRCWDYIEKTEDAVEGPKAFLEKRKPDWKGR